MSRKVITCRRSSDNASCEIDIGSDSNVVTVKDLTEKVMSALQIPSTHFVRLISKGKLLQPEFSQLTDYNLENCSFIHCVVTERQPNEANANPSSSRAPPRGGLNELIRYGLESDEVVALRLTFSDEIERFRRNRRLEIRSGEREEDFTARVENQWILSWHGDSEFWNNIPRFSRYERAIRAQIAQLQQSERGWMRVAASMRVTMMLVMVMKPQTL